ncbi:GMC oxidoreductase [Microbacterium betulae]|uniref:GMC oxidoreductase n=1 Tax=Microbacterium betulae TaxID=2981139 RepID=A0AA97FIJ6_9MICO|nr:GMC oxidoreductase [Microbacterium sp. AB]WOF22940.1 GMC oxidoreductase [Microbacterium sp. AB]
MTHAPRTDVLIVGGGLMGAAVARLLRESDAHIAITMVDAGAPIGAAPGVHLHDIEDPEVWARYNERVSSGIQGMYTGAEVVADVASDLRGLRPGMFHALAFGEDAEQMPATAIAWNAGGMGVHWTAAAPWPDGEETFAFGDDDAWRRDLETARRVLGVRPAAIGPTAVGERVLEVLRGRYAHAGDATRRPQPMPMAVRPVPGGRLERTSPATIFPAIAHAGDAAFSLRTGSLATSLIVEDARVTGARVRSVADGATSEIRADAVVVCADALRTPQLLFASGIRPAALGRYLNEHAFIASRVLVDLERFGLTADDLPIAADGEFCTDSLWIPQNGAEQPFHGQVMDTTYVDEQGRALAHSVGVSLYSPVESRPENRVVFADDEQDLAGMPRMRIEFAYSPADLALIDRALAEAADIIGDFGAFDPATERALLVPGSSLHLTGTVRSGLDDDGTSVCDPEGRVWGFDNLYVAGNGVVPTPVVANATLTGVVTAVRTARAVAERVAARI